MKTETLITGIAATLIALTLIMVVSAFSVHGSSGFFNMGAHHELVTSGTTSGAE